MIVGSILVSFVGAALAGFLAGRAARTQRLRLIEAALDRTGGAMVAEFRRKVQECHGFGELHFDISFSADGDLSTRYIEELV